jgi:hypothetical protein
MSWFNSTHQEYFLCKCGIMLKSDRPHWLTHNSCQTPTLKGKDV